MGGWGKGLRVTGYGERVTGDGGTICIFAVGAELRRVAQLIPKGFFCRAAGGCRYSGYPRERPRTARRRSSATVQRQLPARRDRNRCTVTSWSLDRVHLFRIRAPTRSPRYVVFAVSVSATRVGVVGSMRSTEELAREPVLPGVAGLPATPGCAAENPLRGKGRVSAVRTGHLYSGGSKFHNPFSPNSVHLPTRWDVASQCNPHSRLRHWLGSTRPVAHARYVVWVDLRRRDRCLAGGAWPIRNAIWRTRPDAGGTMVENRFLSSCARFR